ncbi:MAG: farnesyl diphosphate synthase [Kiritimatiellia bacterium]|nr:farnesyl diphosphate synthase [Kiritimatiellia bacterium]
MIFSMFDLTPYLADRSEQVNSCLDRLLPPENERPEELHRAMRYSLFCGGKRIRPILCMASAEAVGGAAESALIPAAALECLHTYTLIHDDLPAMDNDDLRRGKPTSHKVFGEANAILAGDSLLTFAFELLAQEKQGGRLALELARASGSRGVAGGQYEDLKAEREPPDADRLDYIHIHKTAMLIRAACRMGGLAGGGSEDDVEALGQYGEKIGLAFQVADDILNETSSAEVLGKAVGSDAARGKMTYVALHGIEASRQEADRLVDAALVALAPLRSDTTPLVEIARFIVHRDT